MSFKLSQPTKDFFDVIRAISSYFSIAAIGIGIILFAVDKRIITNFLNEHQIIAYSFGVALILIPLIAPAIYKRISLVTLKRRNLSNIIIERQDVIIDITGKGEDASYYERLCFYKIGKNYNHYLTKLIVTGTIDSDSIHCLNCFYNLNNEKNRLTISYVNNTKKLNNYSSLVKGNEKFLVYSAKIKDSFINEEESWDLLPRNYCIFYNLSFAFPEGKKILYAKLYKKTGNDFEELEDISPIIITENNRHKLILQIVDYDYGDLLSLRWKLG